MRPFTQELYLVDEPTSSSSSLEDREALIATIPFSFIQSVEEALKGSVYLKIEESHGHFKKVRLLAPLAKETQSMSHLVLPDRGGMFTEAN